MEAKMYKKETRGEGKSFPKGRQGSGRGEIVRSHISREFLGME